MAATMDEARIAHELRRLAHLELDALRACELAAPAAGALALRGDLGQLRAAHAERLAAVEEELAGQRAPPADAPDARERLLAAWTTLRALGGAAGALAALRDQEQLVVHGYARALALAWPERLLDLVRDGLAAAERALDDLQRRTEAAQRGAEGEASRG